jgi:hypothetical protein
MVTFSKLDQATVAALFEKPEPGKVATERARIREEYKGYLSQLAAGEGGELVLSEGEDKAAVRNRLNRAAKELNVQLEYKRTRDNVVRFRIVSK